MNTSSNLLLYNPKIVNVLIKKVEKKDKIVLLKRDIKRFHNSHRFQFC